MGPANELQQPEGEEDEASRKCRGRLSCAVPLMTNDWICRNSFWGCAPATAGTVFCRGGGETIFEAMRKPHLGKAYIGTYLLYKYLILMIYLLLVLNLNYLFLFTLVCRLHPT